MSKVTTAAPAGATTYAFSVVLERDEDVWHAFCPALREHGAVTWGQSRDEALRHIREVVEMVVHELLEDSVPVPAQAEPIEEPSVIISA